VVQGKHIGTCLGDLFSVNFIEESEKEDLSALSLQTQFEKVRLMTSLSHVMQWGDVSFTEDRVSSFIGRNGNNNRNFINLRRPFNKFDFMPKSSHHIDSRLMKIKLLTEIHKREGTV